MFDSSVLDVAMGLTFNLTLARPSEGFQYLPPVPNPVAAFLTGASRRGSSILTAICELRIVALGALACFLCSLSAMASAAAPPLSHSVIGSAQGKVDRSWVNAAAFAASATAAGATHFPLKVMIADNGTTSDICPNDYRAFKEDLPPLICGCSADAVKGGAVWAPIPTPQARTAAAPRCRPAPSDPRAGS